MRIFKVSKAIFFFLILLGTFTATYSEIHPDLTIMVPMRDETELPTDLYFPPNQYENLPCILIRSPAGRNAHHCRNFAKFSNHGFLIAIQDTRSSLDSEGKTIPYLADGWGKEKDGYDAVEWLAKSSFTNGKIGTYGFSALGITQQMMAPTAPPSLKCQYIGVAAGSLYHHAVYPGGCLLKNQVEGWLGFYAKDSSVYKFLCSQPNYNEFWSLFNTFEQASSINTPAIHLGGWFDIFIQGTIDSFLSRQKYGQPDALGKQKLIIGPWTHHWPDNLTLGDFKVPENAKKLPKQYLPEKWFASYLTNTDKIDDLPAVTYYVMGSLDEGSNYGNEWRTSEIWPIPATVTPFYFTSKGRIETKKENKTSKLHYTYIPSKPIPTIGGRNLFMESGPKDQSQIEMRDDILVFTSKPLNNDMEITGQIFIKLFCNSAAKESQIIARFCDVYPDGRSILIADGMTLVKPNDDIKQIEEVNIDLWTTSIIIGKGHSLRVSISNSNYPRIEKKIFDDIAIDQLIYTGHKYPSSILLPLIKNKK